MACGFAEAPPVLRQRLVLRVVASCTVNGIVPVPSATLGDIDEGDFGSRRIRIIGTQQSPTVMRFPVCDVQNEKTECHALGRMQPLAG